MLKLYSFDWKDILNIKTSIVTRETQTKLTTDTDMVKLHLTGNNIKFKIFTLKLNHQRPFTSFILFS